MRPRSTVGGTVEVLFVFSLKPRSHRTWRRVASRGVDARQRSRKIIKQIWFWCDATRRVRREGSLSLVWFDVLTSVEARRRARCERDLMPRLHQRNLLRATSNLLRATCCAGVNAALEHKCSGSSELNQLFTQRLVDFSFLRILLTQNSLTR